MRYKMHKIKPSISEINHGPFKGKKSIEGIIEGNLLGEDHEPAEDFIGQKLYPGDIVAVGYHALQRGLVLGVVRWADKASFYIESKDSKSIRNSVVVKNAIKVVFSSGKSRIYRCDNKRLVKISEKNLDRVKHEAIFTQVDYILKVVNGK